VLNWEAYGLYEEQESHVLSDKEVADKKQLHIAYNKSAAGMERTRRFRATPKGKAAVARHRATPKDKASTKRARENAGASEEAGNKRPSAGASGEHI
jgi:hypothetical protein